MEPRTWARRPVKFSENVRNARVQESKRRPGPVAYDEGRGLCRNVVLEVRYELVWSGIRIEEVRTDVLTGDVDLSILAGRGEKAKARLVQFFEAKFRHAGSNKTTGGRREVVRRSGNPGYDVGMPVVFADIQEDEKAGETLARRDRVGFRTWGRGNGPSSLCQDSSLVGIGFGVDTIAECYVPVARSELKECKTLAARLRHLLSNLTRSVGVSKYGAHDDFADPDGFVRVVRDELRPNRTTAAGDGNSTKSFWPEEACDVPARVRTTFLYTDSGGVRGGRVNLINGVRVRLLFERWRWICPRVNSMKRAGCSARQRFPIRSEVEFVEIPAVWHNQNTTKFWLIQVTQQHISRAGRI